MPLYKFASFAIQSFTMKQSSFWSVLRKNGNIIAFFSLLSISCIPFILSYGNRVPFVVKSVKNSYTYTHWDRYSFVSEITHKYPNASLYYLQEKNPTIAPNRTASWEKIQITYQAYPREITLLTPEDLRTTISPSGQSILFTNTRQVQLTEFAEEFMPHPEYFVYVISGGKQ